MAANRDGTANLLEAAAEAPPRRCVLVSALAAAGPTTPGHPVDERRPPAPVSDYGRSKLAAEVLVRAMSFPWTIVRPPIVYGEWDHGILTAFKLVRVGVVPRFGDGSQELSVIYAGDLAEALIAAGSGPATANRIYFAAHPVATSSTGLIRAIGRALGQRARLGPIPRPAARALLWTIGSAARRAGRSTILSADKAEDFLAAAWTCRADALERDTGWRARVDLEAGARRTPGGDRPGGRLGARHRS